MPKYNIPLTLYFNIECEEDELHEKIEQLVMSTTYNPETKEFSASGVEETYWEEPVEVEDE